MFLKPYEILEGVYSASKEKTKAHTVSLRWLLKVGADFLDL